MSFEESTGFCRSCNRPVLTRREQTYDVLHFLLSIATLGVWIPVWLCLSVRKGGWRCAECGSVTSRFAVGLAEWTAVGAILATIAVLTVSRPPAPPAATPVASVAPRNSPTPPPEGKQSAVALVAGDASIAPSESASASAAEVIAQAALQPTPEPEDLPIAPMLEKTSGAVIAAPRVNLHEKRISIQSAVQKVCDQAGYAYDWQKSFTATQPDCKRFVSADLAGVPLERALDRLRHLYY